MSAVLGECSEVSVGGVGRDPAFRPDKIETGLRRGTGLSEDLGRRPLEKGCDRVYSSDKTTVLSRDSDIFGTAARCFGRKTVLTEGRKLGRYRQRLAAAVHGAVRVLPCRIDHLGEPGTDERTEKVRGQQFCIRLFDNDNVVRILRKQGRICLQIRNGCVDPPCDLVRFHDHRHSNFLETCQIVHKCHRPHHSDTDEKVLPVGKGLRGPGYGVQPSVLHELVDRDHIRNVRDIAPCTVGGTGKHRLGILFAGVHRAPEGTCFGSDRERDACSGKTQYSRRLESKLRHL